MTRLSYDIHCIVAAVLFLVSNLLGFIYGIRYRYRTNNSSIEFDFIEYMKLNTTIIENQYEFRNEQSNLVLASGFINSLAWFTFIIPVIKLCWILSNCCTKNISYYIPIVCFTISGSIIELLSRILELGIEGSTSWISSSFQLNNWTQIVDSTSTTTTDVDSIGWKTLELVYIVSSSILLWVDATESLFLFGIFIGLWLVLRNSTTTTSTENKLSSRFITYTLLIGILCLFDFSSSLLRYRSWMIFSTISFIIETINTLFLLPIWLLWLGKQLPTIIINFENEYSNNSHGNSKQQSHSNDNNENTESTFS